MWLRGFCGCARVSSNYTVWWSVAGRICTRIRTLVAFYDGNQTDGRHFQFALPQTFWQIFFKLSRVLLSWVLAVVGVHLVSRPIDRVQNTKSGYTWMCVECVSPLSRRFFCLLFLDEFLTQSLRSLGVFVLVHLFYFAWTANWGGRRSCQSNKYSENIFKFSGILETSLRVFLQSFLNFSLQL